MHEFLSPACYVQDWDTEHELSWNWFWENVERMLKSLLSKPKARGMVLVSGRLRSGMADVHSALLLKVLRKNSVLRLHPRKGTRREKKELASVCLLRS